MDVQNLVKMANQIGTFFDSMPDPEQARADIATHLKKFWDPRMRKAIVQGIDAGQVEGLSPIVRDAITAHRGQLV